MSSYCETAMKDDYPDSTVVVELILKEDEVGRLQSLVEKTSFGIKGLCINFYTPKRLGFLG
ncbi:hypothetical protein Hanom_Chr09g00845981 [Helianthus anomalus]